MGTITSLEEWKRRKAKESKLERKVRILDLFGKIKNHSIFQTRRNYNPLKIVGVYVTLNSSLLLAIAYLADNESVRNVGYAGLAAGVATIGLNEYLKRRHDYQERR